MLFEITLVNLSKKYCFNVASFKIIIGYYTFIILEIVFFGNTISSTVPSFLKAVDQFVHAFICRWNAMLASLARISAPLNRSRPQRWTDEWICQMNTRHIGAHLLQLPFACVQSDVCFFFRRYLWAKCLPDSWWTIGVETVVSGLGTSSSSLISFFFRW